LAGVLSSPYHGFATETFQVAVTDGRLDVTIQHLSGASVLINGLVVEAAPSGAEALVAVVVPERGPAPLEISGIALGVKKGEECEWDFGDGTRGRGETVSHTYLSPGTYTVTLRAGERRATALVVVDPAGE